MQEGEVSALSPPPVSDHRAEDDYRLMKIQVTTIRACGVPASL